MTSPAAPDRVPLPATGTFTHGPERPRQIPILPGLNVGRSYYDYSSYRGTPKRYRSAGPDTIAITDGPTGSIRY